LPTFRWPVRGKVISSYGAKTNGKTNDGINLPVPEGTPVRAAKDGVVDFSGNEQKSYGNLVLVRHSNGYVTAYAHASEVLVNRGDTISVARSLPIPARLPRSDRRSCISRSAKALRRLTRINSYMGREPSESRTRCSLPMLPRRAGTVTNADRQHDDRL
jgi:hypothetical protein